ncbi:hypothetical protein ElyMa_000918600 [Elysia marginata]|uniref:Reverse transcriptase domain-containing protein n=1 Tax=Elysia marginata TaxID=1093978 RepID=A0AAV4HCX3_9GAST|nr:hypothetical protein ElyMa_000918600 [Elysia marginata]
MKRATNQQPRGITWKAFNHLGNEDFADDIALLSHSQKDMQEKTSCVETTARSIGLNLKISHSKSKVMKINTKSNKTWRTNQRIESKLRGFEGQCGRRILGIQWEHRVTKKEISERTGIRPIVEEVKKRRWKWLGHVLRMGKCRHPLIALTWNPQGARKKGRPQGTWRRSVESERVESGKTWNELNWLAQDRCEWRKFVGALCSQGDYE